MVSAKMAALFAALLLLLVSCTSTTSEYAVSSAIDFDGEAARTRVIVSSRFAQKVFLDKTISLEPNTSALEALKSVANVDTRHGGGFVQDINGLRSQYGGGNSDWFLYVNGIQTKTGGAGYILAPADIQQWDFHNWGFHTFTPAIIGSFPEPFLHGYEGKVRRTLVVYEKEFVREAESVAAKLIEAGVGTVSTMEIDQLASNEKSSANLILVGTMNLELISELNKIGKRMGFFTRFDEDGLVILNDEGETSRRFFTGTGLIQATQNPWNPKGIGACENVVWMVSGTDESGVKLAADTILNQPEELEYLFAAVVTQEEIMPVPPVE